MHPEASPYVHGYHPRESARLLDQASVLEDLIHCDVAFPPGSRVLEVGCGVGAQTVALARRSPGAEIVAIDVSGRSAALAGARVRAADLRNVRVLHADVLDNAFDAGAFDHAFVCLVLEHLPDPASALLAVRRLLRPGGTITVVEGDHGSTCLHPHSPAALKAVGALVQLQRRAGGDADIGRRLYPLLDQAGYTAIRAAPVPIYVDGGSPDLADRFTRRTFAAMIEGVGDAVIQDGLIDALTFEAGVQALHRAAEPDGVFVYTFFKAVAERPAAQIPTETPTALEIAR